MKAKSKKEPRNTNRGVHPDAAEDTHRIQAYSLRMPDDLREAVVAEVEAYNDSAPVGAPRRTLADEIIMRLYSTLGVDSARRDGAPGPAKIGRGKRKAGGK
jgi:hypothetical protein